MVPKEDQRLSQVSSSKLDYSAVAGKDRNKETSKSGPICNNCKKKGHVKSECWALQKKNQQSNDGRPSPNALTAVQGKFTYSQFEDTNVKPVSDVLREKFRPFVFNGLV